MSALEKTLEMHIKYLGLEEPEREYKFHPKRRWRFDFAWKKLMIAVECEGGIWTGGRHVRGKGFEQDCEKYNAAALLGWKVFRFTNEMIEGGIAIGLLEKVIGGSK